MILLAQAEAKRRVREQIEADKRERAEKAARDKALREGGPVPVSVPPPNKPGGLAGALAGGAGASASGANSSEARLRVRAPKGTWTGTVPAEKSLADVEKLIQQAGMADGPLNVSLWDVWRCSSSPCAPRVERKVQTDTRQPSRPSFCHPFLRWRNTRSLPSPRARSTTQFSTTFPRKVFSGAEAGKSLKELGLVPNAALEASAAA